ncbi:MAG: site-2 protease family protein [Kiritimatiellae bacterium]|nr:site-2 protease family protein [Kiritimatiellia bacterium]
MSNATTIATIRGIPIRVHISLWIILPLIAMTGPYPPMPWGLLFAVSLFACVALHELGHALVALKKGVRVRDILLLPIGGVAQMEEMPSEPRDEIWIAAAGPAVSLLLALLFGFIGMLLTLSFGPQSVFRSPILSLPVHLAFFNLILAVFNLAPSFPMDGGRIFRAWMTPRVGKVEATRRAAKIGKIMAIAFGLVGLFSTNFFLIAIAIFIYFSAGAEYRAVQFQDLFMRNMTSFGRAARPAPAERTKQAPREYTHTQPPTSDSDSVTAEPVKDAKEVRRINGVFDDLYKDWH